MGEFAVELVDVSKHFGNVVAVDHVSLQIEDGEFFSLLGPSGCGKTTTLRMVAGFELPTEGELLLHGRKMGQTPAFKRPVNTVFQNYALFPHMSIEQNVGFGLQMKGELSKRDIKKHIMEALEMVQLPHLAQRRPNQLSGGQQQRIALARALVNRPEVLLLDEPLGALDLKLRKAMQIELKQLQDQVGITFIYVTHDQEEALTMSDRIAVISEGKVLQVGEPMDIYEHPRTRFVADFIGESNFLPGVVESVTQDEVIVLIDNQIPVRAHTELSLSQGQPASVVVRPEKIALGEEGDIAGQITELVYIGTDTRYVVKPERVRLYHQGETVKLSWSPAQALVLVE